jgi:hypothetical protein
MYETVMIWIFINVKLYLRIPANAAGYPASDVGNKHRS